MNVFGCWQAWHERGVRVSNYAQVAMLSSPHFAFCASPVTSILKNYCFQLVSTCFQELQIQLQIAWKLQVELAFLSKIFEAPV